MPKSIVICLDGTGNQFRQHNTNVVKLYRVAERNSGSQVAYYDAGVGTLADPEFHTPVGKKLGRWLGLAVGRGLVRNMVEAYKFLMSEYEEGDKILAYGFSRGAYTARVLAGFIDCCGLMQRGCQNLIPYALKLYRARRPDFQLMGRFKATYARRPNVKVDLLGLWDTVSTVGWIYNPVALPGTTNNRSVRAVRHAVSIDERRVFFKPRLWGDKYDCDLKEVWFAGGHSDVGGGYPEPESGLAKIALQWMIDESRPLGLQVDEAAFDKYVLGTEGQKPYKEYQPPDPHGPHHESLRGLWWPVEFLPQREWHPAASKWKWKIFRKPGQRREIPDGADFHDSVEQRIRSNDPTPG